MSVRTTILVAAALAAAAPAAAQAPAKAPAAQAQQGRATPAQGDEAALQMAAAAAAARFAEESGLAVGALSVCDEREADLVTSCAGQLLATWPMPDRSGFAARGQGELERIFSAARVRGRSAQASSSPPQTCGRLLEQVRASGIWKFCERPAPPPPVPSAPARPAAPPLPAPQKPSLPPLTFQ